MSALSSPDVEVRRGALHVLDRICLGEMRKDRRNPDYVIPDSKRTRQYGYGTRFDFRR